MRKILLLFISILICFTKINPAQAQAAKKNVGHFQDCDTCREMVQLKAGSYLMGATKEEFLAAKEEYQFMYGFESPQHKVDVKAFAISKFDVTRGEFAVFARETGFSEEGCKVVIENEWTFDPHADWQNPGFKQTDRDPVICVSWDDAQKYIAWLNSKIASSSAIRFRLPTEEEWEYAARAGTTTPMYWGDDREQQCRYENARDLTEEKMGPKGTHVNCSDGYARTAPVGSFQPNPWGLFDMLGNVEQWLSDCSGLTFMGYKPINSEPLKQALAIVNCNSKITRGGSWSSIPFAVRSANRTAAKMGARASIVGFRLAEDLPD